MLFLPHKQQCQKSEGKTLVIDWCVSKSRLWIRVSRDHKRRGRTWKGECGRHNSTWFISNCHRPIYLRQEDHVFVVVCLFVSNFAQKLPNGFPWNFQEDWQWANEQMIKYWWQSGSGIRIRTRICIVTLVRRALAEVCTVPVLLVSFTRCTHCILRNKCETAFTVNSRSPRIRLLTFHFTRFASSISNKRPFFINFQGPDFQKTSRKALDNNQNFNNLTTVYIPNLRQMFLRQMANVRQNSTNFRLFLVNLGPMTYISRSYKYGKGGSHSVSYSAVR